MLKNTKGHWCNTDTANKVGTSTNGKDPMDDDYMKETLFRGKTNFYFLYGMGGKATRYAKKDVHGWKSGEDIEVVSGKVARDWARENLSGDEYKHEFVAAEDDGRLHDISVKITGEVYRQLREICIEEDMMIKDVVSKTIMEYHERHIKK